MAPPAPAGGHSLAILDDYACVAPAHFSGLSIRSTSFPSTLPPSSSLDAQVARLRPYSILSTMRERTPLPAALLSRLPNLRLVLTTGPRNAAIDLAHCAAAGIPVVGTRGVRPGAQQDTGPAPSGYASTTQHALALLLSLTGRVAVDDAALKSPRSRGAWQSGLAVSLAGKTLGVVGLGKLGGAMARACALGLGMKVVAWSESLTPQKAGDVAEGLGMGREGIRAVGKEELFAAADVVSVHYVLSERSRGVVGREEIGRMKSGAVLVNTARGPLVDEDALYEALVGGKIRGAALDVYWSQEPLEEDSRWRTTEWGKDGRADVVLSPHMGYVNEETLDIWYAEQAETVKRFLAGQEELGLRLA